MHIVTILRYYLGLTQMELAEHAGISFADVNEIETKPEYGRIGKYCKLAAYLHVPVHTIVMNDILSVPDSFFDEMSPATYTSPKKSKAALLGRQGEDHVFQAEKDRLLALNPRLAKLVLPCYKLHASNGYDILSYHNDGTPFFIEVKTSAKENGNLQLTKHEYETASKWTDRGYDYRIFCYSNWGQPSQSLRTFLFQDLREQNRMEPTRYHCDFRERKEVENGILHFRKLMGVSQIEAAYLLDIPASSLCKYETGESQCPVTAYQKLSKFYQVTIDQLLQEYPA